MPQIVHGDSTNSGIISEPRKHSFFIDTLRKRIDTTSLAHSDSTVKDSIRIRFLPGMGQVIDEVDTTDVLYQKQILWSDAKIQMLPRAADGVRPAGAGGAAGSCAGRSD